MADSCVRAQLGHSKIGPSAKTLMTKSLRRHQDRGTRYEPRELPQPNWGLQRALEQAKIADN